MSQQLAANPVHEIDPHRLAWGVLLVAFAVFCTICIVTIVGVDYFLFQSSIPIEPMLSLGRGSVAVSNLANPAELVGRNGSTVPAGAVLSTNAQSQGTLLFFDPKYDFAVASVALDNNSTITLRSATRPRFDWSQTQHVINLTNVSGDLSVDVAPTDGHNTLVVIQTTQGATVNLQSAGQYTVSAADDGLTAYNQSGQAVLVPSDRDKPGYFIPVEGMGTINYESGLFSGAQGYTDLLSDSYFERLRSGSPSPSEPNWVCSNDPGNDPVGQFEFMLTDGIMSLRMVRDEGATTHGRTSCVQSFGQAGLDIAAAGFNYLSLNATLYIAGQTLQVCGFDGSECPITLRMDYVDADGEAHNWFHGFYAREAPNFPLRCSTCLHDHDLINEQAWYTYSSPNLLTLFSPELPPTKIVALWLYASGHEYDVRVSDVSLYGANLDLEAEEPPAEGA